MNSVLERASFCVCLLAAACTNDSMVGVVDGDSAVSPGDTGMTADSGRVPDDGSVPDASTDSEAPLDSDVDTGTPVVCFDECPTLARSCTGTTAEICSADDDGCLHLNFSMCADSCMDGFCQPIDALDDASTVAAGGFHSCALLGGGDVVCWGWNTHGQLGDGGAASDRDAPVNVSGLTSGVTSVASGGYHSCAVVGGALRCWGRDHRGQLGDGGTNTGRSTPVDVVGLSSGVTAVAAGNAHTCAVVDGGVECWGNDQYGQLGDGGTFDASVPASQGAPVDVMGLGSGVVAIAAGEQHTCALLGTGAVRCWGDDTNGQLGDGGAITPAVDSGQTAPVDVAGLSGVTAIAAGGSHTCVLDGSGAVRCWGLDHKGQLGDGLPTTSQSSPVEVTGLPGSVTAIDAGQAYSCALIATGAVACWGDDIDGELADGDDFGGADHHPQPVLVDGLPGSVTSLATGDFHNCFVLDTRNVWCAGWDIYGQLGDAAANLQQQWPVAVVDVR